VNREQLDEWCKRAILVLTMATLIFGPLALGAMRASEFVVLQWLILGVLVFWLVRLWLAPKYRFLMPPTAWAVLPFVAYAVWRYRTADIEYLARQELIQVLMAAVIFLSIVNNLFGQKELRVMVIGLIAVGTFVAMYGIYQWLTKSQHVWHFTRPGYEGRGSGTYICPNHLAGFLEMICPLAITLTLFRGFGALPRILFSYASLVMLVGIATTGSRGGWVSTAAAVTVLLIMFIRKKAYWWMALALLLAVGGTGKVLYEKALKTRGEFVSKESNQHDLRIDIWTTARAMWKDHPWIGVGPGHFDYRYRGYRPPFWAMQDRPGHAHNDYLNTLADWGVAGLILVLLPILIAGAGVVISWKNLQRSGDTAGSRAALTLGASVGLVAILVHSIFDFNMHVPANAILAAALLAIITAHWRFASQNYWITSQWPIRFASSAIVAGAICYLGFQTRRHTAEVLSLNVAERSAPASKESIAALKEAFRVEPKNAETALVIGEQLSARSFAGSEGYEALALEAIEWFKQAAALNRWDPNARLGAGRCLDWIGQHAAAEPFFRQALEIDPNHWRTRAMMGWHYFQAEQYAEVLPWMRRSLELRAADNPLADTYLHLAEKALAKEKQKDGAAAH
jgi:O-antigen ligase